MPASSKSKPKAKPRSGRSSVAVVRELVQIGRDFHGRGWALGTSGNFSAVVQWEPLRLAITATGLDKGAIRPDQILEVDDAGQAYGTKARASAETLLHLAIVRERKAGAVLHTHSIWSTALSAEHLPKKGIAVSGYEMLKGLDGVSTHTHEEWLPILANSQDMASLAEQVSDLLKQHPLCHGFLLEGHGLYSWGKSLPEAKRHVEVLEFLLEVIGRRRLLASPAGRARKNGRRQFRGVPKGD